MFGIQIRNVQQALPCALNMLVTHGVRRESRNGPVLQMPGPVTLGYDRPRERVMFWPERDANPFFHLMEALWMLSGRDDVAFVERYVKRMRSFSDDGLTFHGAYGRRWRSWFGGDQLAVIAEALKKNPDCRRQVLQIWDSSRDLCHSSKDLPCNTQVYFLRNGDGALDMTVCNRSNDLVWGALGANAVHFSILQEYMAAKIGCQVGHYWQFTNNLHGYLETFDPLEATVGRLPESEWSRNDPYAKAEVTPMPLCDADTVDAFDQDLKMFMDEGHNAIGYKTKFFRRVVLPLETAHVHWRMKDKGVDRFTPMLQAIELCEATDWQVACYQWTMRRFKKAQQAEDSGVNYDA